MKAWQQRLHEIIYEADTKAGKAFDVLLIALILLSITSVTLESVDSLRQQYGTYFRVVEWFFTVLFTVEYILRILAVQRRSKYIFSFWLRGFVCLAAQLSQLLLFWRAVLAGNSFVSIVANFPDLQIGQLFAPGQNPAGCTHRQPSENCSFPGGCVSDCVYCSCTHAPY